MKKNLLPFLFVCLTIQTHAQIIFNKAYHSKNETANPYLVEISGDLYFSSQNTEGGNFGMCNIYKHTNSGQLKFNSNVLAGKQANIGFKTLDNKLLVAGENSICDVAPPMQDNFICKLDTNGTAIFTATYSAPNSDGPKAVVQYNDSSYFSFTDSVMFHHSKTGAFILKKNLGLTNISSAIVLINNNILLSAKLNGVKSLIQISNNGLIVVSKSFPELINKFEIYGGQNLIGSGIDENFYKVSPAMNLIGQANYSMTIDNFVSKQDTIYAVMSSQSGVSNYRIIDTLFNTISLSSTNTNSITQNAICLTNNMVYILATAVAGNNSTNYLSHKFVSFSQLNKFSNHNFQYDLALLSVEVDSMYTTSYTVSLYPNTLIATSHLRVKAIVKNNGSSTINNFKLNCFESQSATCGNNYFQEQFSGLNISPGGTISISSTGFASKYLDQVNTGTTIPVDYCFYTSLPNGTTDKTVEDNEACKTIILLVTSLNKNSQLEQFITFYPNPFSSDIIIEANSEILEINIYNALGQLIKTHKDNNKKLSLDNSDLQNGIYFLHVETEKGTVIKKVLKN